MSRIDELIAARVRLNMELEGLAMTNVYGMDIEQRVNLERRVVDARRQLWQIEAEIKDYIEGRSK